jgi:hypothetical protein
LAATGPPPAPDPTTTKSKISFGISAGIDEVLPFNLDDRTILIMGNKKAQ